MDLLIGILYLTLNVYHEARSEDQFAQTAVAHVTMNRAVERKLTIKQVVLQPARAPGEPDARHRRRRQAGCRRPLRRGGTCRAGGTRHQSRRQARPGKGLRKRCGRSRRGRPGFRRPARTRGEQKLKLRLD